MSNSMKYGFTFSHAKDYDLGISFSLQASASDCGTYFIHSMHCTHNDLTLPGLKDVYIRCIRTALYKAHGYPYMYDEYRKVISSYQVDTFNHKIGQLMRMKHIKSLSAHDARPFLYGHKIFPLTERQYRKPKDFTLKVAQMGQTYIMEPSDVLKYTYEYDDL